MDKIFQSTHPARDATSFISYDLSNPGNFNPRIPRGMRPKKPYDDFAAGCISIHASREGCDMGVFVIPGPRNAISIHASREGCDRPLVRSVRQPVPFQSTHPARDATPHGIQHVSIFVISIHASREGCDFRDG